MVAGAGRIYIIFMIEESICRYMYLVRLSMCSLYMFMVAGAGRIYLDFALASQPHKDRPYVPLQQPSPKTGTSITRLANCLPKTGHSGHFRMAEMAGFEELGVRLVQSV
jgi:hypothetical protein